MQTEVFGRQAQEGVQRHVVHQLYAETIWKHELTCLGIPSRRAEVRSARTSLGFTCRTIPSVSVSSCVPACFWVVLSTQPVLSDCDVSPVTSTIVPDVKSLTILFNLFIVSFQKRNQNLWGLRKETVVLGDRLGLYSSLAGVL